VFFKLVILFIFVPLADLFLLLVLSDYTGWKFSVAMVILSGIVGAYLAKRSYRSVLKKIREQATNHQLPTDLLTDGAMIFFAAGLLLTPGFITDAVGFTLLIPPCRRWYKIRVKNWLKRNFKFQIVSMDNRQASNEDGVVDGQVLQPESPNTETIEDHS
jgi:UPF0716 protein FxsA